MASASDQPRHTASINYMRGGIDRCRETRSRMVSNGRLPPAIVKRTTVELKAIQWNPHTEEWFCTAGGRTSDHTSREDVRNELELYECRLPLNDARMKP